MDIARLWRQQASNLRLQGSRCKKCEAAHFPERIRCSECGGKELEVFQFNRQGTVMAHTTVYEAKRDFTDQVPFIAALIKIDDGPVIPAVLTDVEPDDTSVGIRVEMVTRRIRCDDADSPILYGYKFAPIDPHE